MLFSVVVPVYNVECYLQECIDSIVTQIIKFDIDAEVLLLDDGSTDASGQICDFNYKKYPNIIRVLHKKNEGLLCTRRKGFLISKGEYIVNCDSDDILTENALQTFKKKIEELHPDILIYNMGMYDGIEKIAYYNNCFTTKKYAKITREQVLDSYFTADVPVVTSMAGKVIKKSCIDMGKDYSKFYDNSFGEDTLQSAEVYANADDIIYVNEVLYYYRVSTGMSSKFKEDYYENFLRIIRNASTYDYICNDSKYHQWFTVKMLKTLARSITQSKNKGTMTYKERRMYFQQLSKKDDVKNILDDLNKYKKMISIKYWILLMAFKYKMYFSLHILLSV